MTERPLVIGVGNRWRGDDGIGPAVVDALQVRWTPDDGVDAIVAHGEAAALLEAWTARTSVVVVDAVVAGAPPGTIHRLDVRRRPVEHQPAVSGHGGGVAAAVELGRALGRLPEQLIIVGVEPRDLTAGAALTTEVAESVAAVVTVIEEELDLGECGSGVSFGA